MQDYFLESLKLQRIDFFLKLVAASECTSFRPRIAGGGSERSSEG